MPPSIDGALPWCLYHAVNNSSHEEPILTATKQLIRVGHSPDPDDAFMFYALANDQIDTGDYDSRTSWSTSKRSTAGRSRPSSNSRP